MITFEGIEENLRFIVVETQKQVAATRDLLENFTPEAYETIFNRDDYIDNLKNTIEHQCYTRINTQRDLSKNEINRIRAIHIIAVNLERIADNCVSIIQQTGYLDEVSFLEPYDYQSIINVILEALEQITPALKRSDLGGALAICKAEYESDRLYEVEFARLIKELRVGEHVQYLITVLFIFRYLERMGDSLLNIGEALLFAIMGERIKIHQFESLQQTLNQSGFEGPMTDIDFQSIMGTRSGCRIGRVERPPSKDTDTREGIFKEGNLHKIRAEKENLENWDRIMPGLAPKVLSYNEHNDKASILVQFISGKTFDEIILTESDTVLKESLEILMRTMYEVWEITRQQGRFETDFVSQIMDRMDQICEVHPEYCGFEKEIGGVHVRSSMEMLENCKAIESEVNSPNTVMVHGDFNCTNLIYDAANQCVHYVDVYRSTQKDFVQDVSVFLISNFRMPVFDEPIRPRLNQTIQTVLSFAEKVAHEWGDTTFQARMAFAIARSLYTSTRLEFNQKFSKEMYLRAHYLMEKIVRHSQSGAAWDTFTLPTSVLFY